jgi:hypothetical protein
MSATEQSAPVHQEKAEESKADVSVASQATQEEEKTHDVQYADEETTAKVSFTLYPNFFRNEVFNVFLSSGRCVKSDSSEVWRGRS